MDIVSYYTSESVNFLVPSPYKVPSYSFKSNGEVHKDVIELDNPIISMSVGVVDTNSSVAVFITHDALIYGCCYRAGKLHGKELMIIAGLTQSGWYYVKWLANSKKFLIWGKEGIVIAEISASETDIRSSATVKLTVTSDIGPQNKLFSIADNMFVKNISFPLIDNSVTNENTFNAIFIVQSKCFVFCCCVHITCNSFPYLSGSDYHHRYGYRTASYALDVD
jgi:hypothetical protein